MQGRNPDRTVTHLARHPREVRHYDLIPRRAYLLGAGVTRCFPAVAHDHIEGYAPWARVGFVYDSEHREEHDTEVSEHLNSVVGDSGHDDILLVFARAD